MVYRRTWMIIFSGLFEPLFYLFSMGIGLGHFVGKVPGPGGRLVDYSSYIAPALLASAAMNGAVYDSSNVFWKLKYNKVYDAVMSTPVGPADVTVGETVVGALPRLPLCRVLHGRRRRPRVDRVGVGRFSRSPARS